MSRVLFVDDDERWLSWARRMLRSARHELEVETFTSPGAALARAAEIEFDVALADFRMPEMDGARFFTRLRELQPGAYRVLISGYPDEKLFRRAINDAQIHRFVEKPTDGHVIEAVLAAGVRYAELWREAATLRARNARLEALLEEVERTHPGLLPKAWRD